MHYACILGLHGQKYKRNGIVSVKGGVCHEVWQGELENAPLLSYEAMNCSEYFEGADVVLNDRGDAIKIIDDNGGFEK